MLTKFSILYHVVSMVGNQDFMFCQTERGEVSEGEKGVVHMPFATRNKK